MERRFVLHCGLLGSPESLGLDRAAMAAILISALRVPRRPFTAVTTALLSSHMDLCHRYPGLNPLSLSKIRSLDRDRAVAIPDGHVSATSTRLRYCRTTRCFPRRLRTPLIDRPSSRFSSYERQRPRLAFVPSIHSLKTRTPSEQLSVPGVQITCSQHAV